MKICLVSLDQKWEDKDFNIKRCEDFIKLAINQNSKLIIFPEMTLTGFSVRNISLAEDFNTSDTIKKFQTLAKKYTIFIMFGVTLSAPASKAQNALITVNNQGKILSKYIKMHPFSVAKEDEIYLAGNDLTITEIEDFKIGNSICYDLRFPELYRLYAQTINTHVNIANWPVDRIDHWNTLLKARAIENLCYMVGVNRTGIDGLGYKYVSSSIIFDPAGKECRPIFEKDELTIYEIDINEVAISRSKFPFLNDRKLK
jgi:omega-amidase